MSQPMITIGEIRPIAGQPLTLECPHAAHVPPFDAIAAQHCPAAVVRERWPRFVDVCSARGQACTLYASIQHCEAGGWFA